MKVNVKVLNENIEIPEEILNAANGDELVARIFLNRGYSHPETIRQMLDEQYYKPTGIWEFPGMNEAVKRIVKAIKSGELIAVYGDYDVDGVTSTVTLVECLNLYTSSVIYHVPDRFTEGYGMNSQVISSFGTKGVSLIITCDCGVSNTDEIALAKSLGMDVIVTDHHNLPDSLPPAEVVLNPKLLGKGHKAVNISGCAMAYFLCKALLVHYNEVEKEENLLDLLALSLIADVVSLNGENRYLLKKALPKLFETKRIGLRALFSIIEKGAKLTNEESVAFQIAPRINAAGRMESARLPVELLLCKDRMLADEMAQKIDDLNQERKRVQNDIIKQASDLVETKKKNKTILVLFNESWHHGIIGIAAGKICETYRKPAILLSMKEDGETVVGSARSTDEVNIYELIKMCKNRLIKFGGHSKAAGLSLKKEDLEKFTREIEELAEKLFYIKDSIEVSVDWRFDFRSIDESLYARLSNTGPFGEGFEQPVFLTRGVTAVSDRKTDRNHHIMVLADENDIRMPAVKWFGEDLSFQGGVYDIVYKLGRNTYKGNTELQLTVQYILEAGGKPKKAFEGIIADERRTGVSEAVERYKDGILFYEGLKSRCAVQNTVNRFNVPNNPGGSLIFLSVPVNSQIFREVVTTVNPKVIVINFSILPDYSFKGFMTELLGVLKYIINRENGEAKLEQLSMRLCVEEELLIAALKYLNALGKLEFSIDYESNQVYIGKAEKAPCGEAHMLEKNLKDALQEKNAYTRFVREMEIEKFREYLK
jgi:single-stranded-DNA-specific exonuclease